MPIQIDSWNSITVCGMKGKGKTELIRSGLLPTYESANHEYFIFDPTGEFDEYPSYQPETDTPAELEKIAKVIWNRWNVTLIVAEAELFLPVNKPLPPHVAKIVMRGRHRNIGMVADTRRIADLNKTVFSLSEHCFIFNHFSPNDIRYLQAFVPADCKGLARLEGHAFWHYSGGKVEVCEPIKVLPRTPVATKDT